MREMAFIALTFCYILIVMYFNMNWKNTDLAASKLSSKFFLHKFKLKESILKYVLRMKQVVGRWWQKSLRHLRKDSLPYAWPVKILICFVLNQYCESKLHRRLPVYKGYIYISPPLDQPVFGLGFFGSHICFWHYFSNLSHLIINFVNSTIPA